MQSILFLSIMNGDAWGGSEEIWYRMALWMSKHEYEVAVCVFDWEAKKSRLTELEKSGCKIYLIPNSGSGLIKKWRQRNALSNIPYKKYDLVFVNQGGWKDVAHGPFKNLYKKLPKYVLSFHNYHLGENYPAKKTAILHNWIKNAGISLAASRMIFEMLQHEYNIIPADKAILYNPITFEPPLQNTSYNEPGEGHSWNLVMLAALDVYRKAQDVLIKVLGRPEWKNRNWQLLLYGEGRDKIMLQGLINKLQLENKVRLMGHTSQAKKVLSESHLLLQATHLDAMPISVPEAMAMSRPCLVSIVGDMPDWISDGQNGFITTAVTEDALHACLEKAWAKRNEWKQMGIEAYKTFLSKYPQPYEEKMAALLSEYAKK